MNVSTDCFSEWSKTVRAGELIYLSGTLYTARDAAHKKMLHSLRENLPFPIPDRNAFIYYAGPTPSKGNLPTGSCGPTTASRMDLYLPELMYRGLVAVTIGKGPRSDEVTRAVVDTGGLYLCAIGGAGALAAECIKSSRVIAYEELGCESIKKMEIENFPLYVGIDSYGNSIFTQHRDHGREGVEGDQPEYRSEN